MTIEFDETKSDQNRKARSIRFEIFEDMTLVKIIEYTRTNYGETRFRAWGFIDGLAYALVYTPRNGNMCIISLRRMHKKEMIENDRT